MECLGPKPEMFIVITIALLEGKLHVKTDFWFLVAIQKSRKVITNALKTAESEDLYEKYQEENNQTDSWVSS